MGVYIGFIEIKGNEPSLWFNFKPLAELRGSQLYELTSEELDNLLPQSDKRNISFTFNWNKDEDRDAMDAMFTEKSLTIFEFTLSDLLPNNKPNGERNPTGYKVPAIEMIKAGKIRPLDTDGIFYAIHSNSLISDFKNDSIVEIDSPYILDKDQVFVEQEGFWAGPYEVGYREYTSSYYIKPQIKENKYTINGFNRSKVRLHNLVHSEDYWSAVETSWSILVPKQDADLDQIDVISDEVLIQSFKDSLQNSVAINGKVSLDDIPSLLERYEKSVLAGNLLTEEVRRARLNRLVSILTSEEDVDETLQVVNDFFCDLLLKYQDSPNVEDWLEALLEKNPELIEQLKDSKAISERIAILEQDLTDLQQQKADVEQEIEEKSRQAETINKAAIEETKNQMLSMDTEYAEKSARLAAITDALAISADISALLKKYDEINHEVTYLESHKNHLERDTSSLELQFHQLISRKHEEMVNITFDGFMASKLLNAAGEWEKAENQQHHDRIVAAVNNVPAVDKTPEELINYLCKTIQVVRPSYKRNTIVNIAICITQGFLTVFSGEPGCGKTSICDIFGNVLGLNKLPEYVECDDASKESTTRYVPVSVERGWTSKRDFVGYYNPLSKSFDKSNRSVFDALHLLDSEKREGLHKFPYLILLDEANLSPMEYYWSDFMNVCDDLGPQSKVNLGENYVFGIPETLHFLATINNDHTTETLSPRLIDRAWIISLPQQFNTTSSDDSIPESKIELVTWASLCAAFSPSKVECEFSSETKRIYDAVTAKLREKKLFVSPRIEKAIKRYWAVASKHFEMDETKTDAATVALDYAVAQKILPKIVGNGEAFEKWIEEFRSLCSNHGLNMSAKILKDIVDRGNQQMKYYQFFY